MIPGVRRLFFLLGSCFCLRAATITPIETGVTIGQWLYTCNAGSTVSSIAPCETANGLSQRPELPTLTEIVKQDASTNRFPVILTAQIQTVNFFTSHYATRDHRLNHGLRLPEPYNANATEVWTFNGVYPGPLIRASLGDILEVQLRNLLPVSVGLFVPGVFNAREPLEGGFVPPGQTKRFEIPLARPGTFTYHSAVDPQRQVPMGLFGVLVVTETASAAKDPVVVISSPQLSVENWQIMPPFVSPALRAEEQYNGREGNVLLVNGQSTSAGHRLMLASGAHQKLRLINASNGRFLRISIPPLEFSVLSQWVGDELYAEGKSNQQTTEFVMLPGATAEISMDILDEFAGREYNLMVSDGLPISQRRVVELAESVATGKLRDSPVVSETWTSMVTATGAKVAELLLVPTNDGLITPEGFTDSLDLGRRQIGESLLDNVASVASCNEGSSDCHFMSWGFGTSAYVPDDAELMEASLLFEVFCPPGVDIPRIDIKAYGVSPEELLGNQFHVPHSSSVYEAIQREEPLVLAHSVVACSVDRFEAPVDLRHYRLTQYLQTTMRGAGLDGKDSLGWIRASFQFAIPETAQLFVATRAGAELPPPTLRLVYKSLDPNAEGRNQAISSRSQDVRARRRQAERILHELQNEQQDLKLQLQILYDRVKQKQRRQRSSDQQANWSNTAEIAQQRELQQRQEHTELIRELALHLKQQEDQRALEKKLVDVHNSDLPAAYKDQLIHEIQIQLQKHYLQQQINQQNLKRRLDVISKAPVTDNDPQGSLKQSAFRGSPSGHEFTDSQALKQEKILYMKLYKHYNDLVGQMSHLRASAETLAAGPGRGLLAVDQMRGRNYFKFVELPRDNLFIRRSPQVLLRLNIVQGLAGSAPQITTKHFRRLANDIERGMASAGNSSRVELQWTNRVTGTRLPIVQLRLAQSEEADFTGNVPMWISTRSFLPEADRILPAGSLIIWQLENPTLTSRALYFHRVLLEVFEIQTTYSNGTEVIRAIRNQRNTNNGHLVGLTIPAAPEAGDGASTIVRAVSAVPRINAQSNSKESVRWHIRVQGATLEHLTNGMTTRLFFNVAPSSVEDEAVEGIAFYDMTEEDEESTSRYGTVLTVAGVGLLGGLVVLLYRGWEKRSPHHEKQKRRLSDGGNDWPGGHLAGESISPILDGGTPVTGWTSEGPNFLETPNSNVGAYTGTSQTFLQSPDRLSHIKHRPMGAAVGQPPSAASLRQPTTPIV